MGKLRRKYNLSIDQYNLMLERQNSMCFLCLDNKKLCVDHNHTTNKVRKILCDRCNRGLGYFKENVALLIKAAHYINDHLEEN